MKAYDIIIPHYNGIRTNALATRCVSSIRRFSRNYRIIWVQNGGEIPPKVETELQGCEAVERIRNEQNAGYVKATNQGLEASRAARIVLLNNDTAVPADWLPKLAKPLENPLIGMTGPLSSASGSWQGRLKPAHPYWIIPPWLNLAFFCVMTRRDVVEKIGTLDEGFGPGLGDDDDYSIRMRRAGLQQAVVANLLVFHYHRTTFKALYTMTEIQAIQREAVKRLEAKHGQYRSDHPASGRPAMNNL